jgi:hypothetical protein
MPVTFTIDHQQRFVRARAEGAVGLKDMEAFLDALVIENALPYRKVFNARGAIGRYESTDVAVLAARVNRLAHIDRRGALALVTEPQHVELADRFLVLGRSPDRPIRAFLDEDEALRWLYEQAEV